MSICFHGLVHFLDGLGLLSSFFSFYWLLSFLELLTSIAISSLAMAILPALGPVGLTVPGSLNVLDSVGDLLTTFYPGITLATVILDVNVHSSGSQAPSSWEMVCCMPPVLNLRLLSRPCSSSCSSNWDPNVAIIACNLSCSLLCYLAWSSNLAWCLLAHLSLWATAWASSFIVLLSLLIVSVLLNHLYFPVEPPVKAALSPLWRKVSVLTTHIKVNNILWSSLWVLTRMGPLDIEGCSGHWPTWSTGHSGAPVSCFWYR